MIRENGTSYKVFNALNIVFMCGLLLVCAYPFYYVIVASLSNGVELVKHRGMLWLPLEPVTFDAYARVFANRYIISGYMNTALVLVAGTLLNMLMTIMGAYFLSLKRMRLGGVIMFLVLFTQYFNGGLIPGYLNIQSLGLLDSLWSLILPGAIATYNLIIMRTAFAAVPDSLIESARLDGARHYRILAQIIIPLCMPTIAVILLYYAVGHWNAWFSASIYLKTRAKYPLQLIMREILILAQTAEMMGGDEALEAAQINELIKYALIIVGTVPILILYPFLQRFFVKGVMIGAVKG